MWIRCDQLQSRQLYKSRRENQKVLSCSGGVCRDSHHLFGTLGSFYPSHPTNNCRLAAPENDGLQPEFYVPPPVSVASPLALFQLVRNGGQEEDEAAAHCFVIPLVPSVWLCLDSSGCLWLASKL